MKLYCLQGWSGCRLSANLHIACTGCPNERCKRILAQSRLFASPFSTGSSIKPTNFPNDAQRETSSVRPRIYISRSPARLLATYTRRISNDSFVSFRFTRDNFAHQFSKNLHSRNLANARVHWPPSCRYLFTFCLPAGGKGDFAFEIQRSRRGERRGEED